jgi:hypothetical protein
VEDVQHCMRLRSDSTTALMALKEFRKETSIVGHPVDISMKLNRLTQIVKSV